MFKITNEWLMQHRTKNGGWTKAQAEILYIKYPFVRGWKKRVDGLEISDQTKSEFEQSAIVTCKTKKPLINIERELLALLTIKRIGERKNKEHTCPTALDMIRCGIGANYSGEYYDEIVELVLEPIYKYIENNS